MRYANKKRRPHLFSTRSEVEPAVVVREIDEADPNNCEPIEYVQVIKPKKGRGKKYLPGERLLLKLESQRLKSSKKNNRVKSGEPDIDKLTISINRILHILT